MPFGDVRPRAAWGCAGVILLIFAILSYSESRMKSPGSDEPPHLAAGLSYVETGVFRANRQHPPLMKELSGLSLVLGGIRWPHNLAAQWFVREDAPEAYDWLMGNQLIASNGPDRALALARLPFPLVGCLLLIVVYLWGRQMFGNATALGAMLLCALDPTILGHSFTITMDLGLTAFAMLFLFCLWNYVQRPGVLRLAACGITLGLVLGAKFSAVLLVPVAGVLLLAAALLPHAGRTGFSAKVPIARAAAAPLASSMRPRGAKKNKAARAVEDVAAALAPATRTKELAIAARNFLLICAIALVVVQALYFFPRDPLAYYHGLMRVNADHNPDYMAFLAGDFQRRFAGYFAAAYLLKEPIAAIILAAFGLAVLLRSSTASRLQKLFLLLPPLVLFIGHTILADDIGIRYIMPALPFAYLLGGLGLAALVQMKPKWGRYAAAALCVWLVFAAAGIYPDHLSYFNEAACLLQGRPGAIGRDGGTRCGPLWLDDSNVDWGQGLKQLKSWLDQNAKGRTIRLASPYAFPAEIYGIANVRPTEEDLGRRPLTGLYAVSASFVARLPRQNVAYEWLESTPPRAIVGHAIYVYDFPGPDASPPPPSSN